MSPASMNRKEGEQYNVCFQGSSLDVGNLGCCALTASFIKLVVEAKPNAMISLLYANRTAGVQRLEVSGRTVEVRIVNCRLSLRARLSESLFWIFSLALIQRILPIRCLRNTIIQSNRWLRTLEAADFVGEIRGGDSFSDIYGVRRFFLGIIPCLVAILMRKDVVLLPQTYGPFESRLTRAIARFILRRALRILSRDRASIGLVRELLGAKSKDVRIDLCPDLAFTLEAKIPEHLDVIPELELDNVGPVIGLNVSGLLYVGGFSRNNMFGLGVDYKHFVPMLLEALMKRTSAHVLLVPHVFWDGREGDELNVCRALAESMDEQYAGRLHVVNRRHDQNQVKGIIGLCDFFIGSRMHACIAAMSQGTPAVGLAYSKKFLGVFETAKVGEFVIDLRQSDEREIVEAILQAFEQRDAIKDGLAAAIPKMQERIHNVFLELLS